MKAKQYIYHWLFFPLLAILLAGSATSCINDPVMEEEETTYGKTSLVVTVRTITTDPDEATTYYDEYVKTLRIIGFDASGNLVCNGFYEQELEQVTNKTSIDIKQELENFQGGTCKLYFIANEEYYTTTNNTPLTDFLKNENSTLREQSLNNCIISASSSGDNWGGTNLKPILMTAQTSAYIQSGKTEQNIGTIKLVRCVAKVQLIVQKDNTDKYRIPENDVVKISDVSLHGTRPDSYSLWDTKSHFATNRKYTHSFIIADDNVGYGTDGSSAYTSDMVYFPETLSPNNTTEGVLYFTFTLNYTPNGANTPTVRTYTVAIGEDADDDGVVEDYNIYRNTIYTVTVTLQWQPTEPTMNIQVDAWEDEINVDVPPFE